MRMTAMHRTGVLSLPLILLSAAFPQVYALATINPDNSVVLFENEGLVPASSAISAAGGLTLTIRPTPIVERLDNAGRVLWRFDERRQTGIDINLMAVVSQADDGVVVCANRESLPGQHYEQYPAYVFKLDRNGKEVARFDPMKLPRTEWPFLRLNTCVAWGDDLLLVGKAPPSISTTVLEDGDQQRGQAIAVRMHGNLSTIWSHLIPTGGLGLPHMQSRTIDQEHLLLAENDTLVELDADGNVDTWQAVRGCLLVSPFEDTDPIRLICQEPMHPGTPWEIRDIDRYLHVTRRLFLPNGTGQYPAMMAACALPGDHFAVVAKRNDYSDLLIFDFSGKLLKTVRLPTRMELNRSGVEIQDIFAQDNSVVGVALTMKVQYGSSSINWVRLPVH